jgi:hypothetical protein
VSRTRRRYGWCAGTGLGAAGRPRGRPGRRRGHGGAPCSRCWPKTGLGEELAVVRRDAATARLVSQPRPLAKDLDVGVAGAARRCSAASWPGAGLTRGRGAPDGAPRSWPRPRLVKTRSSRGTEAARQCCGARAASRGRSSTRRGQRRGWPRLGEGGFWASCQPSKQGRRRLGLSVAQWVLVADNSSACVPVRPWHPRGRPRSRVRTTPRSRRTPGPRWRPGLT